MNLSGITSEFMSSLKGYFTVEKNINEVKTLVFKND